MRWLRASCALSLILAAAPARAQFDRTGGSAGDFRPPDRPIGAPPLRFPEAAGFPSDSSKFLGGIGPTSPDEVLKSLDKDLGRTNTKTIEKRDSDEPGTVHKPGEALERRPAAPATLK
jgi:hypothetical protein